MSYSRPTDPILVILEYVSRGKLQTYLRESRAERQYGNLHGSSKHLTSRDLTAFSYQVAKGMDYLANKGVSNIRIIIIIVIIITLSLY